MPPLLLRRLANARSRTETLESAEFYTHTAAPKQPPFVFSIISSLLCSTPNRCWREHRRLAGWQSENRKPSERRRATTKRPMSAQAQARIRTKTGTLPPHARACRASQLPAGRKLKSATSTRLRASCGRMITGDGAAGFEPGSFKWQSTPTDGLYER